MPGVPGLYPTSLRVSRFWQWVRPEQQIGREALGVAFEGRQSAGSVRDRAGS